MKRNINLKDVAQKAGVGLGTASRVLNNHPSVKEETRKLVMEAMKELNYQPNAIARSLKMRFTRTVGVVIPDISSPFYPDVVRGIEDISNEYEYSIMLCNTDLDNYKVKLSLSMLKEKKIDGLIYISNTVSQTVKERLKDMEVPIVLVSTEDSSKEFPCVTIDNENAAYIAVDYLCRLGHKDIGMISGGVSDPNAGIPRIEGYRRALKDNGIKYREELVFEGNYRYKSGYENMTKILNLKCRPTAIFAAADTMAMGASKAILENGLKIPGDISIIGFDGIEATEFFYPPISTIEQPRYDLGAMGMRLLTKLINNEIIDEKNILLDVKLIERESCRRL